ncbi:hypothetical protein WBN73_20940 [Paenarthrobacter sp. CCNWLY172]|uniref:hypothetical protein n=2 Tax=Paenarthrobacter TaxID=1742992 RepID=UPI0030799085
MSMTWEEQQECYERALAAEPALRAVVRVVDALLLIDAEKSEGLDHWMIIKPLIQPWIGYGRGHVPSEASDVVGPPKPRAYGFKEFLEEAKKQQRVPATTAAEKWMRTEEAWDAFTNVLLTRLGYGGYAGLPTR